MDSPHKVIVKDIDMPFWSMVWFMLKWSVAAIPATLILVCVAGGFVFAVALFLAALGASLPR